MFALHSRRSWIGASRAVILASLFQAISGNPIPGQVTGSIDGFVKVPTGARVPSVTVTARMTQQQSIRSARANNEGWNRTLVGRFA